MTIAAQAVSQSLGGWKLAEPPPTLRQFAGRVRYPGGPLKGQLIDIDTDPVHAFVVDQIDSGQYDSVAWCASPQVSGKTLIGILLVNLHAALGCRLPTGYALPTLQDLDKAWASKLKPQIIDSGFERSLPTAGPGARGGRGPTLQLYDVDGRNRAGQLIFMAGGAYGDTAARLAVDEVDQFRKADGTPDWPAILDLISRTKAYGHRRFVSFVGTIETNIRDNCIILTLAEDQGTGIRPWLCCPECGRYQIVSGKNLIYDPTDELSVRDTARILCQHCPSQWDGAMLYAAQRKMLFPHKRQTVDEKGAIVGEQERTKRLGIIENAYCASIVDLPTVAVERWQAEGLEHKGDRASIRKFYMYTECECINDIEEEDGQTTVPTHMRLASLSKASQLKIDVDIKMDDGDSWHFVHVPEWVEFITVGADVQAGGDRAPGRVYFQAYGRGGAKGAILGWGTMICAPPGRQPTEAELHASLDRLKQTLADWAPAAPIVWHGVDTGDQTDELLRWLRVNKDWRAVKGTGPLKKSSTRDRPGWMYIRSQPTYTLRLVETKSVLRVVHGEILARDGEGSMAIPPGLDQRSALVTHICASVEYEPGKWSERAIHRKYHPEWQRRNDYADALCYARAGAYEWQTKPAKTIRRQYGKIKDL